MKRLALAVWALVLVSAGQSAAQEDAAGPAPAARRVVAFDEAIRRALARNPDALTARAELFRAQALVEQARAHSLPSVTALGSYTRLDDNRLVAGNLAAAQDTFAASAVVQVPLLVPVQWGQWSHARSDLRVSEAGDAAVRRAVGLLTARAYLSVLVQRRLLTISVLARDTAKAHYEYVHARTSGGLGNRLDELRALAELQSDETAVELTATAGDRAREALGVLLGEAEALDVEDGAALDAALGQDPVGETQLPARADLQVLERRRVAASAVRDDSWRDYVPYVTGTAAVAYQNPATSTIPATSWQAQLVLTMPVYDGGLRYGMKRERQALADEATIAMEGAVREARSQVRIGFVALQRAQRAREFARAAATAAADTLKLANLAYRGGSVSNLDVIDAERRARDAGVQVAIGEDSVRQARLDVLAATGSFP